MKLDVLIVDDDNIALFMNEFLILNNHFTTQAKSFTNGKEALDVIRNNETATKTYCIFLDINMPIMNGWDFLDHLNGAGYTGKVMVVMVSSSIDSADKEKAKMYPQVIDFFEKPMNKQLLSGLKKHPAFSEFFMREENKTATVIQLSQENKALSM